MLSPHATLPYKLIDFSDYTIELLLEHENHMRESEIISDVKRKWTDVIAEIRPAIKKTKSKLV